MTVPKIYNGRDNRLICRVNAKALPVDLSGVSRITISEAGSVLLDSDVDGAGVGQAIDWSQGTGILVLYLGHQGLSAGAHTLDAVLYNADTPNGIRAEPLRVNVVAGTAGTRYPALDVTPPTVGASFLDVAAVYTLTPAILLASYSLDEEGVIRDENGDPITDETGDAITEG